MKPLKIVHNSNDLIVIGLKPLGIGKKLLGIRIKLIGSPEKIF